MIVYKIGEKIYINLTNKCSNACTFCVRNNSSFYSGYGLWLEKEPSVEEVKEALKDYLSYEEFVFCGYGEPLYRADAIREIGLYLKSCGKKVRVNTNGQADLIAGKGVAEKFAGAVDTVSISLNETNAADYQKLCRCRFGEEGFYSMLRFAKECKEAGLRVILSIVDVIGEEKIALAEKIAERVGAELRVRALIK